MSNFPFTSNRALNRRQEIIATADSTVSFTDLDTSAFFYEVDILGYVPSVDSSTIFFRSSTNNGSSYDSVATDYTYLGEVQGVSTGLANYTFTRGYIALNGLAAGTAANEVVDLTVGIFNPSDTNYTSVSATNIGVSSLADKYAGKTFGVRTSAADVDAIRFLPSSGTMTARFILREYLI